MTKFFLLLTLWSNPNEAVATGDMYALDTGLTYEDCQQRLEQAIETGLYGIGQLTCFIDQEGN